MTTSEPDFGGRIGRTLADSEPSWPEPLRPPGDAPNVVMIVMDDTGFAHFGCYGSTIETPTIDRLAEEGVRYSNFHTTALCSPSRACLLTGRNHHSVGMRAVSNFDSGFPNMRGGITPRAATVAELLRANGYATFAAGKWHLAPMQECSAAGPYTHWPLQKGFDRFYGFLQGETDQFYPELTEDNHHIDPPASPEDGYHVSEDLIDQSMGWIRDLKSVRPDKPFFLQVAFGATHAPHQAPPEYLEKYRGKFDGGWDAAREEWFSRQKEMGLVPEGTTLAERNPGVLPWDELPENGRMFAARLQEAFAAFLDHTDAQIGRLVEFLEDQELLDDTLLIVLSDNGASQEGGPRGVMHELSTFNLIREDLDDIVANRLDDIGTARAHSNIPWGWAQAGNTPLKWYKQNTYGGGVRDPLLIHWPKRIKETGIRHQFCHVTDITPTVLDITGIKVPEEFNGHPSRSRSTARASRTHGTSRTPLRSAGLSTSSSLAIVGSGKTAGRRSRITARARTSTKKPGRSTTWTRTSRSAMTWLESSRRSSRRWSTPGGPKRKSTACCRSTTARSNCSAPLLGPARRMAATSMSIIPLCRMFQRNRHLVWAGALGR